MKFFTLLAVLFTCFATTLTAQTDILTYHLVDGDSVRSHNIGIIHNRNLTLVMLSGRGYDMKQIDYVTNSNNTEKMRIRPTSSSSELQVFRRVDKGKYAELFESTVVRLEKYPFKGTYNQTNYHIDRGNGLEKLNFNSVGDIIKNDRRSNSYYKKANGARLLGIFFTATTASFTYLGARKFIKEGETDFGVFALPIGGSIMGMISMSRRKKKLLLEGFRVANTL